MGPLAGIVHPRLLVERAAGQACADSADDVDSRVCAPMGQRNKPAADPASAGRQRLVRRAEELPLEEGSPPGPHPSTLRRTRLRRLDQVVGQSSRS